MTRAPRFIPPDTARAGGLDARASSGQIPDMDRLTMAAATALASLVLAACGGDTDDEGQGCAQVRVFARPSSGGAECRSFATPCDVPQGYVGCCGGLYGDCVAPGAQCVDDPLDACSPGAGAADCPGVCQ
ncbi:putative lipoprotein [Corallococcus macrosporus]|uniref:Putative lipoprotein n=2 Tax=Myxococcaceae TaxID=31 RepID=F8CQV5_MYXFH|nr:putative lipoprotein [Corallococcus macrosporus]